jgi:cytochrome c5
MARQVILILTLAAVATLSLACGGSSAVQPPTTGSPAVATPAAVPTKVTQPYPVVTPAPTAAPAQPTAIPAAAATPTPSAPAATYPVLKDGLTLMNERCTVCHDATRITSLKQNRAGWETTVAKWKARGAKLTDQETTVLVDFLAANYK